LSSYLADVELLVIDLRKEVAVAQDALDFADVLRRVAHDQLAALQDQLAIRVEGSRVIAAEDGFQQGLDLRALLFLDRVAGKDQVNGLALAQAAKQRLQLVDVGLGIRDEKGLPTATGVQALSVDQGRARGPIHQTLQRVVLQQALDLRKRLARQRENPGAQIGTDDDHVGARLAFPHQAIGDENRIENLIQGTIREGRLDA